MAGEKLKSLLPFCIYKWINVIFYISLAIIRKVLTIPRRTFRNIRRRFQGDPFEEENVKGKICIVTGSNSGIGLETTIGLAKRGCTVIMACRNLESTKKAIVHIRNQTFLGRLVKFAIY